MLASLAARRCLAIFAFGFIPVVASAAPTVEKQKFTLGRFIPQDCWLYVHGVHNPERDFIDEHWGRVFNALKGTGIGDEIKTLIFSGAPVEQRAQVEEGWSTAVRLLEGVRWGDLVSREMVFAERLTNVMPDIIFLCRSAPESVESNVAGFKAILQQIAVLTSGKLSLSEIPLHGVQTLRLGAPEIPIAFFVIRHEDVVGLVLGEKAAHEVTAMLSGEKSEGSILENPRVRKALEEVPAAEDEVGYFDIKMLMENLDGIFAMAFQKAGEGVKADPEGKPSEEVAAQRMLSKVLDQFDFIEHVVFSTHTDGLQEFTSTVVRLQPACMQKSMCKMFTDQQPFERFDKYVPREATGFWVWDGVNLKEFYSAVLTFIRDEISGGPELLTQWTQFQQDVGFSVEADLLSWWSGELVSVSLPPAIRTPFSSADSVLMIRVKDAKLASEKVNAALDKLAAMLKEHNQSLIMQDATDVRAEGFRTVTHPMLAMLGKLVVGVAEDHLILASSGEAINRCLDTAAGKNPSIVENERFKAEGLKAKGPVTSASFTDLSNMGQELSAAFFSMGFVSAFIPDQPDTKPIKAIFGLLSKISPAINEINFYSSMATVSEFDGQAWRTRQVTTYKPAEPRGEAATQDVVRKP